MEYNHNINKIITLIGLPFWLVITIATLFFDSSLAYSIIQLILILCKIILVFFFNTRTIKTVCNIIIPNIKLILFISIFYGIGYNNTINNFSFLYEKILFIVSFTFWLFCNVITLGYDILYFFKIKNININKSRLIDDSIV